MGEISPRRHLTQFVARSSLAILGRPRDVTSSLISTYNCNYKHVLASLLPEFISTLGPASLPPKVSQLSIGPLAKASKQNERLELRSGSRLGHTAILEWIPTTRDADSGPPVQSSPVAFDCSAEAVAEEMAYPTFSSLWVSIHWAGKSAFYMLCLFFRVEI